MTFSPSGVPFPYFLPARSPRTSETVIGFSFLLPPPPPPRSSQLSLNICIITFRWLLKFRGLWFVGSLCDFLAWIIAGSQGNDESSSRAIRPDALCCLLLHRVDRFDSVPSDPISSRSIIIGFLYLEFSRVLRLVIVCSFIFFDWTPQGNDESCSRGIQPSPSWCSLLPMTSSSKRSLDRIPLPRDLEGFDICSSMFVYFL